MPPEALAGSPSQWLRHAFSALELARVTPPSGALLESLCFHAQQDAEKALKAVRVASDIPPPRTHNLRTLLDLIPLPIPDEVEDAAALTDYAVMSRYPGELEPVTDAEYHQAVSLAQAVLSWAKSEIETMSF